LRLTLIEIIFWRSRIVFVGSVAHLNAELDLNDLMLENRPKAFGMGNVGRYANSKLANMYFARELKKRLDGTDVFVSVLCPGIARTKIWRHYPWHVRFRTWLHEYTLESSVEQVIGKLLTEVIRKKERCSVRHVDKIILKKDFYSRHATLSFIVPCPSISGMSPTSTANSFGTTKSGRGEWIWTTQLGANCGNKVRT